MPEALGVVVPDDPAMHEPGFKVMHQADVDTQATCVSLKVCLPQVRAWSEAHPGHMPIMIQFEVKDANADAAELDALDAEVRSLIPRREIVTPDDVRGNYKTLGAAVHARGWPTLGEMRGKVLFTLDNEGLRDEYLAGHPSLEGRVLFTPSSPGEDDAAFAKLNDPIGDATRIKAALAANMVDPHAGRCRHGAGAHERHDDARRGAGERRAVGQHRLRGAEPGVLAATPWRSPAGRRRGATR